VNSDENVVNRFGFEDDFTLNSIPTAVNTPMIISNDTITLVQRKVEKKTSHRRSFSQ
jgi:hypothetical protein